jgi:hypothetical protein
MGDLAGDMVQDVSFRDAVRKSRAQPPWDATQVTKEAAVERGESTAGECKLGGAVVGKEGVGVLKECNQNQPVVDPGRQTSAHNIRNGGGNTP